MPKPAATTKIAQKQLRNIFEFKSLEPGDVFKTLNGKSLAVKLDNTFAVLYSDYKKGVHSVACYLPIDIFAFAGDESVTYHGDADHPCAHNQS